MSAHLRHVVYLTIATTTCATTTLRAAEVVIHTDNARTLRGGVDARTNDTVVWIRNESDGLHFTSAAPWTSIVGVEIDGDQVEVDELYDRVADLATEQERLHLAGIHLQKLPLPGPLSEGPGRGIASGRPRVASLQLHGAKLVNLDRDAAPDGLIVAIAALDSYGAPLDVSGSLYARLWTARRTWREPEPEFALAETWSKRVSKYEFINGIAEVTLKFRRLRPQQEFDLLPDALLTLRLGVSGSGNFSASGPVRLRLYDPYRDRLQHHENSRFVPNELPGHNRRTFAPNGGRYQTWPAAP